MSGWRKRQIQELIERSGVYIAYDNKQVTEKELEALVELTVKECLDQCYYRGMNDPLYEGQLKAAAYIEEHFGIEE